MELELSGKTALITGGSRGIGLAMAARFAEAGANVMITSRKAEDLAEAAAGLVAGGAPEERVAWTAAHVGRARGRRVAAWPRRWRRFGGLDILVNNAGTNPYFGPMIEIDVVAGAEDVRGEPAVGAGLDGAPRCRAGLRGSVINVASVGGLGRRAGHRLVQRDEGGGAPHHPPALLRAGPRRPGQRAGPGPGQDQAGRRALWEGPVRSGSPRTFRCADSACPTTSPPRRSSWPPTPSSWITGQTFVVDGGTTAQPSGGVG